MRVIIIIGIIEFCWLILFGLIGSVIRFFKWGELSKAKKIVSLLSPIEATIMVVALYHLVINYFN